MDKLDLALNKANQKLKANNAGVAIALRGKSLSLRATLPPKPSSTKQENYQQYVSLGIYYNQAGISQALKLANKLSADIALGQFDWGEWGHKTKDVAEQTVAEVVKGFENNYWRKRKRTRESQTTWDVEYQAMLKRLNPEDRFDREVLERLVFSTEPDTRTRVRAVMVANAIASFAGLNVDFKEYKGNYKPGLEDRILPSDEDIVRFYHSIPNPQWQFLFGLLAAYGVSNHEIFHCDLNSLQLPGGRLVSSYRKAHYGTRRIWCLYPEWFEQWDLGNPNKKLPALTGRNNRELGGRVTKAFSRYKLCKPGDLRHCWAIRAMGFIPVEMAARMQAHSVDEHTRTYQRWFSEEQEDKLFAALMNRVDLPKAP